MLYQTITKIIIGPEKRRYGILDRVGDHRKPCKIPQRQIRQDQRQHIHIIGKVPIQQSIHDT